MYLDNYTEELYYDKAGNRSCRVVSGVEELYQYNPRNWLTEYTKGEKALRATEIRNHCINKGERLIEVSPGIWIDPGF